MVWVSGTHRTILVFSVHYVLIIKYNLYKVVLFMPCFPLSVIWPRNGSESFTGIDWIQIRLIPKYHLNLTNFPVPPGEDGEEMYNAWEVANLKVISEEREISHSSVMKVMVQIAWCTGGAFQSRSSRSPRSPQAMVLSCRGVMILTHDDPEDPKAMHNRGCGCSFKTLLVMGSEDAPLF